jgi:hypothetical protein
VKPTIFIASSARDQRLLDAFKARLDDHASVKRWTTEGHAGLGDTILDWAVEQSRTRQFGLFLLTPDVQWGGRPNGNVLLEYGLFVGALGSERCWIVRPEGFELPADVRGRIAADFDAEAFARDGPAALEEPCHKILETLRHRLRDSLVDRVRGLWLETRHGPQDPEGTYSLVQFDAVGVEAKVSGRSYRPDGSRFVDWPGPISQCWVSPHGAELVHMFDAKTGKFESAIGVSVFRFDPGEQAGGGYYIVHGGGPIQTGLIDFDLRRVTPEFARSLGLDRAPAALEDARCEALIAALVQRPSSA